MILASAIFDGGIEAEVTDQRFWGGGSTSSFTFTGVDFGEDTGNRLVVVAVLSASGFTTTCTIGGVSATQYRLAGTGLETSIRFYVANVSGVSGNVVVTRSGSTSFLPISVWAVYGANGVDDFTTAYDASPPTSLTVSVSSGGVALGYAFGSGTATDLNGMDVSESITDAGNHQVAGWAEITADDAAYAISHDSISYVGAISFI